MTDNSENEKKDKATEWFDSGYNFESSYDEVENFNHIKGINEH